MAVDLSSFIRFTAQADGRSTIGLGGVGAGAASEEIFLQGTSPVGRFIASVKNLFLGPSESESRAAQAFIQAIRQEYGSEGAVILKRIGVNDYKPICSFQVQSIAHTLAANRSNFELTAFREISPLAHGLLSRHGVGGHQPETPMFRSIRSAMALHTGQASMLLDDLSMYRQATPKRKLAFAVAVAVVSESPSKLMGIAEFKTQYLKRLDLADMSVASSDTNGQPKEVKHEAQVAGIAARLIEDILLQARYLNQN